MRMTDISWTTRVVQRQLWNRGNQDRDSDERKYRSICQSKTEYTNTKQEGGNCWEGFLLLNGLVTADGDDGVVKYFCQVVVAN